MVNGQKGYVELTEKGKNNVQVILKIPEAFMKRFDETSEQLGYTRTEAIKEAMRRFQEMNEQRLMQRPEYAKETAKQMMSAIFEPIIEMVRKEELQGKRTIDALPQMQKKGIESSE